MATGRPCVLCGRADGWLTVLRGVRDHRAGTPGDYELRRCRHCGLVALHPWPEDHLAGYAAGYSQHHRSGPVGTGRTPLRRYVRRQVLGALGYGPPPGPAGRALAALPPVRVPAVGSFVLLPHALPGGRLLDFGCGNGRFLATMAELGWEAHGVERDPASAEQARAAHPAVTVHDGLDFPDGFFDVITLSHVIEHVDDPVGLLRRLRPLVRPDRGRIGIACPNWQALGRRVWRRTWCHLDPPRHTLHFRPATLRAAVEAAGLTVESVTTRSAREGPYTWRTSWRYRYGRPAPSPVVVAGTAASWAAALAGAGEEVELWARPVPGGTSCSR